MDDPLLKEIHEAERVAARSKARTYGVLLAAGCPVLLAFIYVSFAWVGPFTGACPKPDPNGGLLSDAELCRGSTSGFFLMAWLGVGAWVFGFVLIARRIGRPAR